MRSLPIRDVRSITGGRPVLILAPHPDDEVLGCAGLILSSLAAGIVPSVTIVTDGTGSHPNSRKFPSPVLRDLRANEARGAAACLGLPLCRLHFLAFRDSAAPHEGAEFDQAVERIATFADASGCGVICAPWQMDPHGDHVAAHKMAAEAARRAGLCHLSYPVWGWALPGDQELGTMEISGSRLRIDELLDRKRRALFAHASQIAGIIDDDPDGFQLRPPFLDIFLQPFEVFLENS
jgi:LmbE family N-acetylglucosaminyl deacetylase